MSISTPLLASLQPLQTRHHIQESPSFCKPQGYLLPSQGNPKAQFLATPTTPQGSYSILLHPPQDSYTSSAKPALPAASPLFNPAVPACALYSPVHVPTRRPAYTCLHQPACLPAGHLQNLNPPHLPSPTALASRHHQVLPSCPAMYRPACPCPHLSAYTCLHQPACLHQPGRSRTCHQATNCLHFPFYRAAPWQKCVGSLWRDYMIISPMRCTCSTTVIG